MECPTVTPAPNIAIVKTCQYICPCQKGKRHIGVFAIEPKEIEISTGLCKVQKEFYLGHGIKTTDPKEASKIILERDHQELLSLLSEYIPGKLGVHMVPPMFYGEVPEAIKLTEIRTEKHTDRVKGDLAESKMYYALKEYYALNGDDVLIVHSHKFLHKKSNNEKDFIVLNLSKGLYLYYLFTFINQIYKNASTVSSHVL